MDLLKNQIHVTSLGDALSSKLLDYRSRDTVPSLESYCEDNRSSMLIYVTSFSVFHTKVNNDNFFTYGPQTVA